MSVNQQSAWSSQEIFEVARWQRYLIWLVLLQLIGIGLTIVAAVGSAAGQGAQAAAGAFALLITMARIVIAVLSIYGVYKVAQSLRKSTAILYALGMILPLIGLIVLLVVNSQATSVLQLSGVKVGLMGADPGDIEQLRNRTAIPA